MNHAFGLRENKPNQTQCQYLLFPPKDYEEELLARGTFFANIEHSARL